MQHARVRASIPVQHPQEDVAVRILALPEQNEARKGMIVSETKSDATTVKTTASGIERMNFPASPGS